MATDPLLQEKINRMAAIKRQQASLKEEWSELEGFFLRKCQEDLADTKYKTVAYHSSGGKLSATMATKVKITWASYLKGIFGDAYSDAVIEKTEHKLSPAASRVLEGIWTKSYSRESMGDVISQLPCDDKTRKTLGKKLKGINYETDKRNLVSIGGFDEEAAGQYAYFIAEAAIWESFRQLLKVTNRESDGEMKEIIQLIDGAIVVEETPKITLELLEE